MSTKAKIAVLVSGGGTNLQALIDAQASGIISSGEITLVVSNNAGAYALERASKAGIKTSVVLKKELGSQEAFEQAIKAALTENEIDIIVLAGFMSILSESFTSAYPKRIINVHPSLIPSFCGKGFYGLRVHEAEKTKRRDVDNIQSAQKFILDALQHFSIIKNDSRKYVKQIHHTVIDDERDFVIVRFEEKEN